MYNEPKKNISMRFICGNCNFFKDNKEKKVNFYSLVVENMINFDFLNRAKDYFHKVLVKSQ